MTIQLTIYIVKWLHNRLYTNDYIQLTIYIVKWLYNWLYRLSNDYTIDYIHCQMTIQLTIYIVKLLYNWQYT